MVNIKLYVILSSVLILITNCGYLSDKSDPSEKEISNSFTPSCNLAPEAFTELFEKDIKEQIFCLEQNLNTFARGVETDIPNSISQEILEKFIRKIFLNNVSDQTTIKATISAIRLFFNLNTLILKDKIGCLSKDNISVIARLLISINSRMITINDIIQKINTNAINHTELKDEIFLIISELSDEINNLIASTSDITTEINIEDFLSETLNIFDPNIPKDDLLFLTTFIKKVFFDGDKLTFSSTEFKVLLERIPELTKLGVDFINQQFDPLDINSSSTIKFYLDGTIFFRDTIRKAGLTDPTKIKEGLFSNRDIVRVIEIIINIGKIDRDRSISTMFEKIKTSVETFKKIFFGGSLYLFTRTDLVFGLTYFQKLLETLYFNNVTYNYHSDILDSLHPINHFNFNDHPEYNNISRINIDHIKHNFKKIVENYRFYRTKENKQFYLGDLKRSQYGINETSILRWGVARIFQSGYGHIEEGRYVATSLELENFLRELKSLLVETNIWPIDDERFKEVVEDIVLLIDLFQPQSNGDMSIDLEETTEYLSLLLTTIDLSSSLFDAIKTNCPNESHKTKRIKGKLDTQTKVQLQCFRNNFFQSFLQIEDQYDQNFTPLFNYLKEYDINSSSLQRFLKRVEFFALDSREFESDRDFGTTFFILNAFLNIESLIVNYDIDNSNKLEPAEVAKTYALFKNIIIEVAELEPDQHKFAKSIFLYLIKYKKMPEGLWDVVSFHYNPFVEKKATVKRKDIGTILYYIKKEMNKNKLEQANYIL